MFRNVWYGNLAAVGTRSLYVLAALWLAASGLVVLRWLGPFDHAVVQITTNIQAGFLDDTSADSVRDRLPTDLHTQIVYKGWLRGEFGAPDTPQAREFGVALVDAQAFTWSQFNSVGYPDLAVIENKKKAYIDLATNLGSATDAFTGNGGSRTGAGLLALLQSVAYSLFQFLAKLVVLATQLLLRVLAITAPLLGLMALLGSEILRTVAKFAGSVTFYLMVFSVLSGVHAVMLRGIFDSGLPVMAQLAIASLVTGSLLAVSHPLRMVKQAIRVPATSIGNFLPVQGGVLPGRFLPKSDRSLRPHEIFWTHQEGEKVSNAISDRRHMRHVRPEGVEPHAVRGGQGDVSSAIEGANTSKLEVADRNEFATMGTRRKWRVAHAVKSEIPVPPKESGDSTLIDGSPVYHRETATVIGYDSRTLNNADNIRPEHGFHDVIVHGANEGQFLPGAVNAAGNDLSLGDTHPNHIADAVMENPHYQGGAIRLIACHSAVVEDGLDENPAAQAVADRIGVPVKAPTNSTGPIRSRGPGQEPRHFNDGYWKYFKPKKDEE
jgi:hypothetical protein